MTRLPLSTLRKATPNDYSTIKAILDHPRNKRWVGDEWRNLYQKGVETFCSDEGVIMLIPEMAGIYNVHLAFMPKAKPDDMIRALLEQFKHSVLMAAIPEDNRAATRLARRFGWEKMAKTAACYDRDGLGVSLNIYRRINHAY